ncbi:hypothetical protein GQ53DRAFT_171063 [Thozetella sp. PMI_491]|nr:hypothetical protein GQ53DRAFT_171063 [Thozetella sp. PMI_491]
MNKTWPMPSRRCIRRTPPTESTPPLAAPAAGGTRCAAYRAGCAWPRPYERPTLGTPASERTRIRRSSRPARNSAGPRKISRCLYKLLSGCMHLPANQPWGRFCACRRAIPIRLMHPRLTPGTSV